MRHFGLGIGMLLLGVGMGLSSTSALAATKRIEINSVVKKQLIAVPKKISKAKVKCLISGNKVQIGTLSKVKRKTYFSPISKKTKGFAKMQQYCKSVVPTGISSSGSSSSQASSGSSSSASSCLIPNGFIGVRSLAEIADADGRYILCSNITAASRTGLGQEAFAGVLDGNGMTISNLTINQTTPLAGLFSVLMPTAVVKNLHLQNVSIRGSAISGAVAGISAGTIENVSVSGSVETPLPFTGALVGIQSGGSIENSTSTATVRVSGSEVNTLIGIRR